jgi:Holliday junction resolvase RusA-like endonuclease
VIARYVIEGRLPSLNDYIGAQRSPNHSYANRYKQKWTDVCAKACASVPVFSEPVSVSIVWYERDRRRDLDNVTAATKFVLDGLVHAGKLRDDSQKYVKNIEHRVEVDKERPRVEVEIRTWKKST